MTQACAEQVAQHVAPVWAKSPVGVAYAVSEAEGLPDEWVVAIIDSLDQASALGWHRENQGTLTFGAVLAEPFLANDGNVLSGKNAVSSALSHMVIESFIDPHVTSWRDVDDRIGYALEVCDPVESLTYDMPMRGAESVTVSDFVTPAWFDPLAGRSEKFDWLDQIHRPFEVATGGCAIRMEEGAVTLSSGPEYPEWRREIQAIDTGRFYRRLPGRP
jgi:hypothetical protein